MIGLDFGLKNDRTVLTICHAEDTSGPPLVVFDRLHALWQAVVIAKRPDAGTCPA